MTEFVLVRHGETDWNASGRLHGSLDIPLNETGIRQARALGALLTQDRYDVFYSSPQSRAYATAIEIATSLGRPDADIVVSESLRERNFGDAEGTSLEERRLRWPDKQWPNAEPIDTMYVRVRDVLNVIQDQYPEERVLLVTHGSWVRSALRIASDFKPDVMNLSVPNASLTRIRFDGTVFDIVEIGVVPTDRGTYD